MMHMDAHTPIVCRKRADLQKFQEENTSPVPSCISEFTRDHADRRNSIKASIYTM